MKKNMNYQELESINKKYLDTLDLAKYIQKTDDVETIIDMIKRDYDDRDDLPIELEGCIFNYLGAEDVAHYLANRYGKRVQEEVAYKLY